MAGACRRARPCVKLFTIGYEKAAWAGFVSALQAAGVAQVIDVRQRPQSRRPGFSKTPLSHGLAEAGIAYVSLRALGTPPEGREANKRRDWDRFWHIVDTSLSSLEAEAGLAKAAAIAQDTPSCLLCYEADPCICHRLRVGEILVRRHGFNLHHLSAQAP